MDFLFYISLVAVQFDQNFFDRSWNFDRKLLGRVLQEEGHHSTSLACVHHSCHLLGFCRYSASQIITPELLWDIK
jgi:hypothetical protein